MQQNLRCIFYLIVIVLLIAGFSLPLMGQTINVTFRANMATNLDTITATNGFIEMRGAYNGTAPDTLPDGNVIDWSSTSTLELTSDGGDYWSITFQLNMGDTLNYKFWTGFDENTGTHPDGGWEGGFEDEGFGDTRWFVAGAVDTVLPLQYYHPAGSTVNQLWRPFEEKTDSVAIYFRVNMGGQTQQQLFDPSTTDTVGVRGDGATSGSTLDWGQTKVLLSRENGSTLDSSFWSGVAYISKDSVTVAGQQPYKFVFETDGSVTWESTPDRMFTYTNNLVNNTMDTTLSWVYFSDVAYDPNLNPPVAAILTFRVSTEAVEGLGLFNRGVGDNIYVIGPNGFDIPDDLIPMTFIPGLQEWAASEQFSRVPGTDITYKYFIRWDSSRVDTMSPNYIPKLVMRGINDVELGRTGEDSGWEEPSSTGGADRKYTWTSDPQQFPEGDFGFDRHFFNGSPANSFYDNAMSITFSVNMQPATDALQNTNPHLFVPGTDSVWIQFDGSLFALSQGWFTFGERAIVLEDPDQDMVYTGTYVVDPNGWYQLGFLMAYGTRTGGYVTNGGGTQSGRRYYQYIHPDQILPNPGGQFPITVWPNAYTLSTIDWVEDNLPFETPPDLTTPTGIEDEGGLVPLKYVLDQNYPNPFNPTTTIRYQLARFSQVQITIYNISGQIVKKVVDEEQSAGSHLVEWNGINETGNKVASGIYFVRMKAGDFNKVRKMTLIR
jgi:hypothetical protein